MLGVLSALKRAVMTVVLIFGGRGAALAFHGYSTDRPGDHSGALKPAVPVCLLLVLTAGGTQPAAGGPPSRRPDSMASAVAVADDLEECAAPAKDPGVTGEGSATSARSTVTTAASLETWLAQRASTGGLAVPLSSYADLDITSPTVPLTACVFRTDPRPTPVLTTSRRSPTASACSCRDRTPTQSTPSGTWTACLSS